MSPSTGARLTVIGSGTLFPSAARSSASLHLMPPPGGPRSVLLDCGWGTLHALPRHGVDWKGVDAVGLTHWHGDHAGDLPALFAAWQQSGRSRPLTLFGPADLAERLRTLATAFGDWMLQPRFPLEIVPLEPGVTWERGGTTISATPTPHTRQSVAFRLTGSWGSLGYSGDTEPSAEVATFLARCDVLVAECALPDPPPFGGHLTPEGLADLAGISRPELLVVTHVYPPAEPEEVVRLVRARYPGRTVAGADGMVIRWGNGQVAVDRPAGHD